MAVNQFRYFVCIYPRDTVWVVRSHDELTVSRIRIQKTLEGVRVKVVQEEIMLSPLDQMVVKELVYDSRPHDTNLDDNDRIKIIHLCILVFG